MIKYIAIIVVLIFSISCALVISPEIKFVIENNTDTNLVIKTFNDSKILDNILIKSHSAFDTTFTYQKVGQRSENTPFDEFKVDSLVIVFSDLKIIEYSCDIANQEQCNWENSPMIFPVGKRKMYKTTKVYSIEEIDHTKAKPL
jgi:hypothetical protein